uniref:Uncharacterized protein n=1 Tax=Oryza meridionalis TaxID=40149 RepID=A0A0E0DVI3_9ORYZ
MTKLGVLKSASPQPWDTTNFLHYTMQKLGTEVKGNMVIVPEMTPTFDHISLAAQERYFAAFKQSRIMEAGSLSVSDKLW